MKARFLGICCVVAASGFLFACSDNPSDGDIEDMIVQGSDRFGPKLQKVEVLEGILNTSQYNGQVAQNELLNYLVFDGFISLEQVIEDGAVAPRPDGASQYGSSGNGEWRYVGGYSEVIVQEKLDEFIAEDESGSAWPTSVRARTETRGFSQTIPSLEVKQEPVQVHVAYLPVYVTRFGSIVRKKDVSEISRNCDLSVEYSVKRELTEFGKVAPNLMRNFKETEEFTACLAKYDDGWRVQE